MAGSAKHAGATTNSLKQGFILYYSVNRLYKHIAPEHKVKVNKMSLPIQALDATTCFNGPCKRPECARVHTSEDSIRAVRQKETVEDKQEQIP
jgi:hypothetical protein